jgi:L-ribulose-5-phosphate 4-epimerase
MKAATSTQDVAAADASGRSENSEERGLRAEICNIGKEIDKCGFALFLGVYAPGNLSARTPASNRIHITPSGLPKGSLKPEDLVTVNLDAERINGKLRPSSETHVHCSIYRRRSDVNGIVHLHTPMCMAYAVTNKNLEATTIELAGVTGGPVPIARYVTPGTKELGEVTAEALGLSNAVIMRNHGLVAVGRTLRNAFDTALSVEYTAMVNVYGRIVGDLVELPTDEVKNIRKSILETYGQR